MPPDSLMLVSNNDVSPPPEAIVTTIVSPMARLKPTIMAAIKPESAAGITTRIAVVAFRAPNPAEASRRSRGTALRASSEIDAMSGITSKPTPIPAASLLKKLISSKNENLKSNSTIKRNQKSLDNFSDNSLIFNIFEIDNKDINFLNTIDGVIAVKVKNRKVDNYQKNIEINNNLNLSLSKSFFNDYSNYFIENLATKHKLVRNYIDLENFLLNTEVQ